MNAKEFIIEVTETRARKIRIRANTKHEALAIVEQRYIAGTIIMNANDTIYSKVDFVE